MCAWTEGRDLFIPYILMLMNMSLLLFFFFFQAEDGIRDLTVTGVQTCALPISRNLTTGTAISQPDGRARSWSAVCKKYGSRKTVLASGRRKCHRLQVNLLSAS